MHLGNAACDERAFQRYISDSDEHTYYIGIGDLLDSVIVTDKRYRKSVDASEGDAIVDVQVNKAVALLRPLADAGRILGLGSGNHEDAVLKYAGTDPTRRICDALGVPDIGLSGLFKLNLTQGGQRGRQVVIRYHHGWGGGSRTQGADLSKFSRDVAYWDADIFLYGHVHRKQTDSIPRLGLCGDKLISKPKVMCICGTFLKTYTQAPEPTYSELKGYPPISTGGVVVEIKPSDSWVKLKAYID